MDIYERFGRTQAQYLDLRDWMGATIELLVRLQAGQLQLEDIDVQPEGWKIKEPADGNDHS